MAHYPARRAAAEGTLTPAPLPTGADAEAFPFSLPVVRTLPALDLGAPVALFVGENGSGKSTLLEAIAIAADATLAGPRRLAGGRGGGPVSVAEGW